MKLSFLHVSERQHAGLILLAELARSYRARSFVALPEALNGMPLSSGYMEEIAGRLKRANLIVGRTGPHGGYRLSRPPSRISMEDVTVALDGPVVFADCQVAGRACPVANRCLTKSAWNILQQKILLVLRKTTLANVIRRTI